MCLVPNRELNLYILSMYYAFIVFQCIFSENNSTSRQFYSYMGIEEKIDIKYTIITQSKKKVYNYNILKSIFKYQNSHFIHFCDILD